LRLFNQTGNYAAGRHTQTQGKIINSTIAAYTRKAAGMNQTVSIFSNEALLMSCGNANYDSSTTAG
jgi:hypothetical protein